MRNEFVVFSIVSLVGTVLVGHFLWSPMYWALLIFVPIIILGYHDMFQTKRAIMRNYPVLGRGRYVMEILRPGIYQYFIESDTNGTPINRQFRSIVYARSKQELASNPFGTQINK